MLAVLLLTLSTRALLAYSPLSTERWVAAVSVNWLSSIGSALFTIAKLDQVILKLNVTTQDIGLFKKGAEATINLHCETLKGRVSMIPLAADTKTRFFPVEITFPNKGRKLLPGMYLKAKIHARDVKGVSIPNDAVVYKDGVNFAWIVD